MPSSIFKLPTNDEIAAGIELTPYQEIAEIRQNINSLNSIETNDDNYKGKKIIDQSYIFERKLIEKNIPTKDISYTLFGIYYLDKVDSSIRAVFPLNSSFKLNNDSPSLLLNLTLALVIDVV